MDNINTKSNVINITNVKIVLTSIFKIAAAAFFIVINLMFAICAIESIHYGITHILGYTPTFLRLLLYVFFFRYVM